jgi:molybdopterin synthase catalytic subunit
VTESLFIKTIKMARKKSNAKVEKIINDIKTNVPKFKLQLDSRTTITLKTEEQLSKWMELYPKAELIV